MKMKMRRRGADTNKNIFYLIIAIIVLGASAFGFAQALKAMKRGKIERMVSQVMVGVRETVAASGQRVPSNIGQALSDTQMLPEGAVYGLDPVLGDEGIMIENVATMAVEYTSAAMSGSGEAEMRTWIFFKPGPHLVPLCQRFSEGEVGDTIGSGRFGDDYQILLQSCDPDLGLGVINVLQIM